MKYKIGELTFFKITYSEKHRSCHLCEIVKEYPESKKYLVLCYDYYVVGLTIFQLYMKKIYHQFLNLFYRQNFKNINQFTMVLLNYQL